MFDWMKRAISQNIQGIKILHLIQKVAKFYCLHVSLRIRVLYQ